MDVQGITIDAPTTRDRDDAIWAEMDARGWTVTVCIANVASAITKGSTFDETAHRRVETSYMAGDHNRPMLPRRFSEGSCSITEGQERPVMAVRIRLDHALEPQFIAVDESRLTSHAQISYQDVPKILDKNDHELHAVLAPLGRLADGLMEKRRKEGAFVLYDLSTGWVTSEEGHLRRLKDTKETFGYIIVQELMILANAELARFCVENEIPVPFRNHTARAAAPDRAAMMERINLGLRGPIADLEMARKQFGLVMNKANYGTTLEGHYGLNLPAYLHGTSPIRRYPDLVVQRQVLAFAAKYKLPYTAEEVAEICDHINATLEAKAKEVSQAALERANRQAEKALRKDDLDHLSDREFERVVKVAVRAGDLNKMVADAFLHRLKNGSASLIDMYVILLKSTDAWQPVRGAILRHLIENPHHATSVAAIASQTGGWSEPKFKIYRGGEGHAIVHTVQVDFKKPGIQSRPVRASSSKAAKQRAVVDALASFVGVTLPEWPASAAKSEKPPADVMPSATSDNPVGALGEYCQGLGESLPVYEHHRAGGQDHEPTFIVSCKALDFSVESPPRATKKLAKKQAASMIIKLIHAKANQ